MTDGLKYAIRITGDASSLRQATTEATGDLKNLGQTAEQTGAKVDAATRPRVVTPSPAPSPIPGVSPSPAAASSAAQMVSGLRPDQWKNLSFQVNDVVTSLASGMPVMQVLAQQGGQVVGVLQDAPGGIAGGLRAVGARLLGVVGPVAAVAAGLGLGAKAAIDFASGQDEIARSLNGVGRLSGATVAGINATAEASAGAARVSVATAREMASTFAATGKINASLFGDLTVVAARYAKTTGMDVPEATAKLATALSDPVKGAIELNERLGFLSGSTLQLIERQVAMGDRTGALRTVTDAMKTSLLGVTEHTNAWAAAYDAVTLAAKKAYDVTGRTIMAVVAPTLDQQVQALQSRLAAAQAAAAGANGNANAMSGADPAHLRSMREAGYDDDRIRAELFPAQPGSMSSKLVADASAAAKKLEEELGEALERQMWKAVDASLDQRIKEIAEKTLKAKGIVDQITPTNADLLQLTSWKTALDEALATGQAPTGTESALKRVNELLKAGGTEAFNLGKAARDAFDQAGLLPFERGLAQIRAQYRDAIKAAGDNPTAVAGLGRAEQLATGAFRAEQLGAPLRQSTLALNEQIAGLRTQRDSFYASAEQAGYLAERQRLINEYTRAGVTDLSALMPQIEGIARGYADAAGAADKFNRASQNAVQGMDELRSGTRGLFTGAFSDLRQGKDPTQTLLSSLGSMSDRLFDRTVSKPLTEQLFGFDGKGGGGAIGDGLSKMLFGDVTAKAGDLAAGKMPSLAGLTTGVMNVTATTVTVTGGLGSAVPGAGSLAGANGSDSPSAAAIASGGAVDVPLPPVRPDFSATVTASGSGAVGADPIAAVVSAGGKVGGRLGEQVTSAAADLTAGIREGGAATSGALSDVASTVTKEGSGLGGALERLTDLFNSSGSPGGGGLASLLGFGKANAAGAGAQDASFADGGSVFGFRLGGYTGDHDPRMPVGVVHGQEYVFDAPSTARIGVSTLEAMRRGLAGYQDGGYVGQAPGMWGGGGGGGGGLVYAPVIQGSGLSKEEMAEVLDAHARVLISRVPGLVNAAVTERFGRRGIR